METTRRPLDWFKTKPQARQNFCDPAKLGDCGESVVERQRSPVGCFSRWDVDLWVARAVTKGGPPRMR